MTYFPFRFEDGSDKAGTELSTLFIESSTCTEVQNSQIYLLAGVKIEGSHASIGP